MFSAEQGVDLRITMSGKTSWPEAARRCELLSLRHRHRLLRQFPKEIQPADSAMQPPYPIFSSVIKLNGYSPALTPKGLPKDWNLSPKKNRIRKGKISEDCHVCHLCQYCHQESGRKRKQAISAICEDCHVCHLCHLCHLWRLLLCILLCRASMESLPCLEDDHNKLNKKKQECASLLERTRWSMHGLSRDGNVEV